MRAIRNRSERTTDTTDVDETAGVRTTGRIRARRRSIIIAVALGALVLGAAYVVTKPGSETPAANGAGAGTSYAEIESFVQGEMAAQRVPGLALGIVEDGRVAYVRGFGKADDSGRAVTPQTPFIIGSVAKSFTALAIMQLVEANKIDLDAPVQRYLPWFRVADEKASAEITVRHLLNHTSGISTKTGRSYQGDGDTSDTALEQAVRKLKAPSCQHRSARSTSTAPSTTRFWASSCRRSPDSRTRATSRRRSSTRSRCTTRSRPRTAAQPAGLASGYNYAFGRPRASHQAFNRGLIPAGYLIASAEDMTHYVVSQLNGGRYEGASVLSSGGIAQLHRPAVPTPKEDTSYGMGWFVGPLNDIPVVHHQGETFNFHSNVVLIPKSQDGVVVLMNAENSLDLFTAGRMGTIAAGVASLVEGQEPPSPPSNIAIFIVFAALFALLVLQARGIAKSVSSLRRRHVRRGRIGPWWRIGFSLVLSVVWALFVFVLVPKQLGLPLSIMANGFPDVVYLLIVSALVALVWAVVKAVWTYVILRPTRRDERARRVAA